ncbi:MAG: hypothetical protein R6X14_02705 [bacterium]
MAESLIPKHGGYRKLRSFRAAQVARRDYGPIATRMSLPHQMVQAARSGVQFRLSGECPHIAEGSVASGTSKKTELKLTNVARASLEELLLDCDDFLRQRGLARWAKDDPRAPRPRPIRLSVL